MYLRSSEPDPARGATLAGLDREVQVWRDSLAVPHVWAKSEEDLFRAMGYVHAQDRLFQMELFRRVADGRMAEMLGADLVDTDRFLRTLGMGRAAAANERVLDPESRALMQAYADGVNAWITGHRGALPPEFIALRFRPEPWTVRNSLSIAKIMAWDLADWNVGLDLQRAVDRVGPALAKELYPSYPEWGVRIVGADAQWTGKGARPGARERRGGAPPPARGRRPRPPHPPDGRAPPGRRLRGARLQLVGDRRRAHPLREADPGQRHAPGPARPLALVPGGAARRRDRRRGDDAPRRPRGGGRAHGAGGVGVHQRHGGRRGLLRGGGRPARLHALPHAGRVGPLRGAPRDHPREGRRAGGAPRPRHPPRPGDVGRGGRGAARREARARHALDGARPVARVPRADRDEPARRAPPSSCGPCASSATRTRTWCSPTTRGASATGWAGASRCAPPATGSSPWRDGRGRASGRATWSSTSTRTC